MANPNRMPVTSQIDQLIQLALAEDIGHGDITTGSLDLYGAKGQGRIIAKESVVVAGLEIIGRVFEKLDSGMKVDLLCEDGDAVESPGAEIARIEGSIAALLTGERTALNFLQRLSGIATHVRTHVEALPETPFRIVDTRKTVPGWRVLEKYAVRVGGAFNHRMGLYDGVLIKDNHIAVCGGIAAAVAQVREQVSHLVRIEVEVTTIEEVEDALLAKVDVIMLDNMDDNAIAAAVSVIGGRARVEVSGRVDKDRLFRLAELGVDIVSIGALTHAARFVDLSMEISPIG